MIDRLSYWVSSGWGGDRVALGKTSRGKVATLIVALDSKDVANRFLPPLLQKFPNGCRERTNYGALAFAQHEMFIGVFAGPYIEREVMPTCAEAQHELALIMRAAQIAP